MPFLLPHKTHVLVGRLWLEVTTEDFGVEALSAFGKGMSMQLVDAGVAEFTHSAIQAREDFFFFC